MPMTYVKLSLASVLVKGDAGKKGRPSKLHGARGRVGGKAHGERSVNEPRPGKAEGVEKIVPKGSIKKSISARKTGKGPFEPEVGRCRDEIKKHKIGRDAKQRPIRWENAKSGVLKVALGTTRKINRGKEGVFVSLADTRKSPSR